MCMMLDKCLLFFNISYMNPEKKIIIDNKPWKGVEYWQKQLAELNLHLNFFNDVVVESRPPHKESGYHLIYRDIKLPDGNVVDIYHADKDDTTTFARVFIYIKNE